LGFIAVEIYISLLKLADTKYVKDNSLKLYPLPETSNMALLRIPSVIVLKLFNPFIKSATCPSINFP